MAKNNTQFAIAVHILSGLACKATREATSGELAVDVKTCPSFLRRVMAKLSKANLVNATTGKSGCCGLARKPENITMLDIYEAVEVPKLVHGGSMECEKFIKAMNMVQKTTQESLNEGLKKVSLADFLKMMST